MVAAVSAAADAAAVVSSGHQIAPLPGSIVCNSIELDSHYRRVNERKREENRTGQVAVVGVEFYCQGCQQLSSLLLALLAFSLIICSSLIIHDLYLVVQVERSGKDDDDDANVQQCSNCLLTFSIISQ